MGQACDQCCSIRIIMHHQCIQRKQEESFSYWNSSLWCCGLASICFILGDMCSSKCLVSHQDHEGIGFEDKSWQGTHSE